MVSSSAVDLWTVIADRIARCLLRRYSSCNLWYITELLGVLYSVLHKLKYYWIPDQVCHLISSFLSHNLLRIIQDWKILEYPTNDGVSQTTIFGPSLRSYCNTFMAFLMLSLILPSMFLSKCDRFSGFKTTLCVGFLTWISAFRYCSYFCKAF